MIILHILIPEYVQSNAHLIAQVKSLSQTPTPDQEGPTCSSLAFLETVGSKELAFHISQYDYELFGAVNVVSIYTDSIYRRIPKVTTTPKLH